MVLARKDHKVYFRSDPLIAEDARRLLFEVWNPPPYYFNICEFIERVLPAWLRDNRKAKLTIRKFEAARGEDLVFVSFSSGEPVLNVDKELWSDANLGDPLARYMLAHEVGHLVLHAHYDFAYSNDPSLQLEPFQDEESSEWQANRFAHHLLVSPELLGALGTAREIARRCGVPLEVAQTQLDNARPVARPALGAVVCSQCGGFVVTRDGYPDTCQDCGPKSTGRIAGPDSLAAAASSASSTSRSSRPPTRPSAARRP